MEEIKLTHKTLYKRTSTGAIQEWQIRVSLVYNVATIITEFGQVGGKIQESREQVYEGKNVGKANETTALVQALAQAQATWTKKLKSGYVDNYDDALKGVVDDIIEGGIFPMLAHKFSQQGHKIKYPALCQGKLDGHRCISESDSYMITLWSRKREPINSVPHINEALKDVMVKNNIGYLDGELYNHEYHDKFEELSSFIRQQKPMNGCEVVQYHVYDLPHPTLTNGERNEILQQLKPLFEGTPIHIVETIIVNDEDELMDAFDHFIELGYEGCMIRNMEGKYVNKRSYDLQKVKEFDDAEFKIINIKVGSKGSMAGKAVFICEIPENGKTFEVKLKGKLSELTQYVSNPNLAIGRLLTVQFQGYTKYGVPRFPVGLRFYVEL